MIAKSRLLLPAGRWLAIGIAVVAASLVAAEAALRTVYYKELRGQIYPLVYQADEKVGYRYIPGSTGAICNAYICKSFAIAANGFTAPSHPRKRSADTYRIVVVGSSNETGIWLGSGENYLERLEGHFAGAGIRAEVVNVSIDGAYRDVEGVILAGTHALEFAPDLVLLDVEIPFRYIGASRSSHRGYMISYNASSPTSLLGARAYIDWLLTHRLLTALYDASFIVRAAAKYYSRDPQRPYVNALRTYITKRFETPDLALRPISLERSVETLKSLQARLRAFGAELILFHYVDDVERARVLAYAGLTHFVLDVPQTTETTYGDSHYSEAGHQRLAEQLFDRLASRGLPPAIYHHSPPRSSETSHRTLKHSCIWLNRGRARPLEATGSRSAACGTTPSSQSNVPKHCSNPADRYTPSPPNQSTGSIFRGRPAIRARRFACKPARGRRPS